MIIGVSEQFQLTLVLKGVGYRAAVQANEITLSHVYTSPLEDSVNGVVHFSYPCIYMGTEVEDVTLWVKDGFIEKWTAKRGQPFLDHIFSLEGTRRFGEAAIGTNYDIKTMTKNILFDEKIGGDRKSVV